jgi:hypothetical protein
MYSETCLNRTFRKPALPEYRPIFQALLTNSLQKKSPKTGHPSKQAIYFGPSAGWFREVSLYFINKRIGPPNHFDISMVFEILAYEVPKFNCIPLLGGYELVGVLIPGKQRK